MQAVWTSLSLALLTVGFGGACASTSEEPLSAGKIEVARQLVDSKDYVKAIQMLRGLQSSYPENETLEMLMGTACIGLGDYPAALLAFQKAVDINDKNQDGRLNLGYVRILLKQNAEARAEFDKILKDGSYASMERVHVNYGLSYMEEGNCVKAQDHFTEALRHNPTTVSAHFNLGKCHGRQRDYTAAIESFNKAVSFCPGCGDPALELAKTYYLAGQKKNAIASLQKLLKQTSDKATTSRAQTLLKRMQR